MSLDDSILDRLLGRAERARLRGSSRTIRESFKSLDSPYWQLTLDDRDRLHARMQSAAAAGSVRLEWSKQGGADRPLEAVVLHNLEKLAAFLDRPTASATLADAVALLAPWNQLGRVREVIEHWSQLKQVRQLAPDSARDFTDALRVLDMMSVAKEDRIVRQLSVQLFGNSKRLEALSKHIDILTAETLTAPARHWSEVFGELGLIKEPQPFLLSGQGKLQLANQADCTTVKPYLGVANTVVMGFVGSVDWVLTVENLTTFHQAARALGETPKGLVLYTAGMPSPSWGQAYRRILASLPGATPVYHWSDHDEGGFRISVRIARFASEMGFTLQPWSMDATLWNGAGDPATKSQQHSMIRNALKAGWADLASRLPPVLLEQEGQILLLPNALRQ